MFCFLISSHSEAHKVSDVKRRQAEEDPTLPESPPTSSQDTLGAPSPSADSNGGRPWWKTDPVASHESHEHACRRSLCWDGVIVFPNVASLRGHSSCLASPDPSLLPGGLAVGECDVKPWSRRINQREVKMSAKDRERERREHRRNWDGNRDEKVCGGLETLFSNPNLVLKPQCRCEGATVPKLGRVSSASGEPARETQWTTGTLVAEGSHSFTRPHPAHLHR